VKNILNIIHLGVVALLIVLLGRIVLLPYFPKKHLDTKDYLAIQKEAGRVVLVFPVTRIPRVVPADERSESISNLLAFDYQTALPAVKTVDRLKIQQFIRKHSLFYSECDYESMKKALLTARVFFWQTVAEIEIGISGKGGIVWHSLSEFVRFPQAERKSFEEYVFLFPQTMDFVYDAYHAQKFFTDYFLNKSPMSFLQGIPAKGVYVKITLEA